MRVNIIGRHPIIQPGFCGVMSLYEAQHLADLSHDVVLYIPFADERNMRNVLKSRGYVDLDELQPGDGAFEIVPILLDSNISLRPSDATIWQSTSFEDWMKIYPVCVKSSRVITKNFPKTVYGNPHPLDERLRSQFSAFDLLAFALKEDYHAARQFGAFSSDNKHKFSYVPRGADPNLLNRNNKTSFPTIAIDTPNTVDDVAISHLFGPLRDLKEEYPDLSVISIGRSVDLDFATSFKFMPYDDMYRTFLNPAWVYCVVDYSQSPAHIRGGIHEVDRSWDSKAIYEVQTIEAQMAGCVIAGFQKNIIPELVDENSSILWNDYEDRHGVYAGLKDGIVRHHEISQAVRKRAVKNFTWTDAIERWEVAIRNLVENDYQRDVSLFQSNYNSDRIKSSYFNGCSIEMTGSFSEDEAFLVFDLADKSRRFVEFGCGGVTKISLKSRANNIESAEVDAALLEALQVNAEVSDEVKSARLRLHWLDVGPIGEWGYPINIDEHVAASYTKSAWSKFPLGDVDTVFVGGRFRVAIALEAALRTGMHCLIIVNDYNDRPHYHALEELLDVDTSAGRMVVLSKGAKWDRGRAFDLLARFRMDPN